MKLAVLASSNSWYVRDLQRAAKPAKRLLTIGEGVLHRIDVQILTMIVAADFARSHAVTGDGPVVHQPTALVNLVDEVVNHVSRADPEQLGFPES